MSKDRRDKGIWRERGPVKINYFSNLNVTGKIWNKVQLFKSCQIIKEEYLDIAHSDIGSNPDE